MDEIKLTLSKNNIHYEILLSGALNINTYHRVLFINREDGEGGQFDFDAFYSAIFDSVDKFFKENM